MTSQGSPISVLRRAIRGGNLDSIEMALFDVPRVDLEDALAIVLLMADADDPRFEPWARRWTERAAATERERIQTLFDRLPDTAAADELRTHATTLRSARSGT